MSRMKKTSFFNFFPTKAEEESSSSSGNGEAVSSSQVSIRRMGPKTSTVNYVDKWKFTKELTTNDVDNHRLSLPQGVMLNNILCYLSRGGENVLEGHEENVRIKDVDTNTHHEMVIFRDPRTRSFFMKGHWMRDFLTRRNLEVGDVIGFCWNDAENCLEFSVLQTN